MSLYTAAMLAELVGVDTPRIRAWQRRGWLVPVEERHRLAYFDFRELGVARQLAELTRAGNKPAAIARMLAAIERHAPHVQRPLAELPIVLDGGRMLVREGEKLVEPGGQLRMDFDALGQPADDESPVAVTIPTPGASSQQLAQWAAELDEAGDLRAAGEMYRAALAAAGPDPVLSFQLAEVLYRAGDLAAARERYYATLELDENYVEARANLGCVLLEQGERELAVAAFEGALRCHEEYADVHYHLARALDDLGRADNAASHWRRFLDLAPDSPWADEAQGRLGRT